MAAPALLAERAGKAPGLGLLFGTSLLSSAVCWAQPQPAGGWASTSGCSDCKQGEKQAVWAGCQLADLPGRANIKADGNPECDRWPKMSCLLSEKAEENIALATTVIQSLSTSAWEIFPVVINIFNLFLKIYKHEMPLSIPCHECQRSWYNFGSIYFIHHNTLVT